MKKYIIINGSMCSGKSTIGKRIAELLGQTEFTAFIEGDFVVELHPHVDYYETKSMQMDNILHMSKNYSRFNKCESVVLSWAMGEDTVKNIIFEISKLDYQPYHFILTCNENTLTARWIKDNVNDWRTDDNLNIAIGMLSGFNKRTDCIFIDTSDLSIDAVAEEIIERVQYV